ncbi:CMRF35-like molecule 5 [Hypomesus transpacificus]|uniref:CMRF35-like molecule 5 n=1 Tax=Hypomesus transpacificus TaxID=137520 RepID=UPI001F0781F3|nr:CMRF35-like molecule 5 [Hypomesus transpacificus]
MEHGHYGNTVLMVLLTALCAEGSAVTMMTGHVGGEISILCPPRSVPFTDANSRKWFCRGRCPGPGLLVDSQTGRRQAASGRYSLEDRGSGAFSVSVSGLLQSDSGTYWCGLEGDAYQEVHLTVVNYSSAPGASSPQATVATTAAVATTVSSTQSTLVHKTARPPLTGASMVIPVSVSLAVLVCALIPVIFYTRWRANKDTVSMTEVETGSRGESGGEEQDCSEDQSSSHQPGPPGDPECTAADPECTAADPECTAADPALYDTIYQALDPQALDCSLQL